MELDLLKDAWPIVDLFDDAKARRIGSKKEEEDSVISIWEENYQDLSGWCIAGFQGRCAFPLGEFDTSKYSGTKSEDNGVSIKKRGLMGKVSKGFLGDQDRLEGSSLKVPEVAPHVDTDASNKMEDIAIKSEIIDIPSMGINDILLLDPIDSAFNPRSSDSIHPANVHVPSVSPLDVHRRSTKRKKTSDDTNVEYSSSISHSFHTSKIGGKGDWDTIGKFDSTESETFDLLSYLCDDDIQSPNGSVVSQDSGPTINSNSSISSRNETPSLSTRNQRETRRKEIEKVVYDEANSSSIATISAALDSVAKMSELSSRNKEKRSSRARRNRDESEFEESRGEKRCLESDSEDRTSDGSYRESREKNNEASRRSRQNKKAKENEMTTRAKELEKDNRILKMKVEELDKLVTSMRTAILRSALRKNS